jgi:neutral ceramidase
MGKLQAGIGVATITPPVGIEMGAWSLRKGLSQGVHDDHFARALVLDDGTTPLAIVSLDLVGISNEITALVQELVAAQTGIPGCNILLNCSHTHTTPYSGWRQPPGLSAGHLAYLGALPHLIAGAIMEGWHARQPAAIGVASTEVHGVTVNRRDPALPVDPEMGVIRVDRADGTPLACLVNYACHGTSVGAHYLLWTADFAGYLARAIEDAEPDCTGMFLQGAEGDIHPWDWYFGNPNPRWSDTYEGSERLGKALAGAALGLFQQIETTPEAEIAITTSAITLPSRPIKWTAEEAEAFLAKVEAKVTPYTGAIIPDRCPGCQSAQRFPSNYLLSGARHEATFARNHPAGVDVGLTVARINDIVLAANPGELFSDLGMQIKARSPYEHTYILTLTNGCSAYIPTRDAAEAVLDLPIEEFTDPVKHRRHYGATITTEIGPTGGEMVVDETLRLIGQVGE